MSIFPGLGFLRQANSTWMSWWVKPTTLPAAEILTIEEKKLNADLNAAVNIT